ncbi:MAG TPA: hypothetical protein VG759_24140 [Candidatus Angelobacter sp.]|jgi:hypothetical protein|nr:hypothetical protein [Candidatus Angelobacter sp.]
MASPSLEPSEQLWNASFDTYYDAFFEEMVADALVARWGRFDDFTKVIVAVTAAGSAISGWTLWGRPGWKIIWLMCSGIAAFVSITNTALGVQERIKAHSDDKRRFVQLRTNLETFRYRLQAEQFNSDKFNREFLDFRKTYTDNISLLKNDTFRTRRFKIKVQTQLNEKLADQIE